MIEDNTKFILECVQSVDIGEAYVLMNMHGGLVVRSGMGIWSWSPQFYYDMKELKK